MKGGLYNTSEVASYLGVDAEDVVRMAREDGLPVITLPGKKRPIRRFSALALYHWMVGRSAGTPIGLEAFLGDLAAVRRE